MPRYYFFFFFFFLPVSYFCRDVEKEETFVVENTIQSNLPYPNIYYPDVLLSEHFELSKRSILYINETIFFACVLYCYMSIL